MEPVYLIEARALRLAAHPGSERRVVISHVPGSSHARDGFSLNAAVACAPHQRDRIERLCRYITTPALALERLSTNAAGQVVYQSGYASVRDRSIHLSGLRR
jgi:hypothetical protein